MQQSTQRALIIGGTSLVGGVAGKWAAGRIATNFGMQLGPWGPVLGALLGAIAGSLLSNQAVAEDEEEFVFEETSPD